MEYLITGATTILSRYQKQTTTPSILCNLLPEMWGEILGRADPRALQGVRPPAYASLLFLHSSSP